ncbi:transglycosylase SLT domain-containing protein [Gemmatimonadota bacterium]
MFRFGCSLTVLGLAFAVACAPATQSLSSRPTAGEANDEPLIQAQMPESTPEDSAADDAALQALRDLEFGSSDTSGLPFDTTYLFAAAEEGPVSSARGGAASVNTPVYDIDIESFATNDRVEYYVDFFLDDARDRFNIWMGRLNRYEGMIRNRFRAAGVPEDLVYLGAIESGYSNTAVSRASAVGMWQFMSYTARDYGMVVDEWVDERRDPFKATDAAARYLAHQYERFGSWYLAAAAYNGGPSRVSRGLRRLSQRGDTTLSEETFFRLSDRRYLLRETRDYVPKLIAATQIAKNPARHGFDSIPYLQPLVFDEITVPGATGLDVLATLADTTTRALVELNPSYYRGVTPPRRESLVRVPRGTGTTVIRQYAELPPEERVNFVAHRISRGETLGGLAQRYGVSLELLMAANPGILPRRLSIGQRLVIPLSTAARSNPGSAPRMLAAGQRYHVVRWGETMSTIAQRYRVRLSDLLRLNDMGHNDILRAGRRLIVSR